MFLVWDMGEHLYLVPRLSHCGLPLLLAALGGLHRMRVCSAAVQCVVAQSALSENVFYYDESKIKLNNAQ